MISAPSGTSGTSAGTRASNHVDPAAVVVYDGAGGSRREVFGVDPDPGLLLKLPPGRVAGRLAALEQSRGQRPGPAGRLLYQDQPLRRVRIGVPDQYHGADDPLRRAQ